MSSNKLTTIAVSEDVKVLLAQQGTAGMSYNDVLREILKKVEIQK